jgi:hypothetical protein
MRGSVVVLTILIAMVLIADGCALLLLDGGAGCAGATRGGANADAGGGHSPEQVASDYFAGWERGDLAGMERLVADPPFDFVRQREDFAAALRVSSVRFAPDAMVRPDRPENGTRVPLGLGLGTTAEHRHGSLQEKAPKTARLVLTFGVVVATKGSRALLVSLTAAHDVGPDSALAESIRVAQETLDHWAVKGLIARTPAAVEDKHIIWWKIADGTLACRIWTSMRLNPTFEARGEVRDREGNLVPPRPECREM